MSTTRLPAAAAALAAGALLLTACTSSSGTTSPVFDQSDDVPFTGCDQVACSGTLEGANYEILLPEKWNGTLLIYSHGYRPAQPFPPDFNPVATTAEPAPGWGGGNKEVGEALLAQGYALTGSAYASNGWAVEDGVAAAEQLYTFFSDNVAKPNRVYVWGDSLGGLITETVAQTHPEWVDGVAPFCGAIAGVVPNFDMALDAEYSIQQFFAPEMDIVDFGSYEAAVAAWNAGFKPMYDGAVAQDTDAIAKILTIAAIVDAPSKTATYDGSTIASQVSGYIESLATALGFGTVARYDVEQRFGGNISSNVETDYAERVDDEERALIDTVGGEGAADALIAQLQAGTRVTADQAALEKALSVGGNPQGNVQDPTITIHTSDDPLVIVQNQSFFRDRYQEQLDAGNVKYGLVQLFTVPPATYPESTGAPYGAGHCNFTPESRLAVIGLLDQWVRDGVYPATAAVAAAMGDDSGFNPLFVPSPWPNPLALEIGADQPTESGGSASPEASS
ncbi:MAG: hypothetical protein R2737_11380 [Candidatus Nanopelagicales bacterium]